LSSPKQIRMKGVRMHNLKNVDVDIPRNALTVVTGVSGSGKSSLIFDTLYAEGQRRYVESLSSYARQFLGRLDKPDMDNIDGLTPCVAIEQKVNTRNPRSTVSTSTEIYDYLKLLFARVGRTISPISGQEVKAHTVSDVVDHVISLGEKHEGDKLFILSRIYSREERKMKEILGLELQKGFSRAFFKGKTVKIEKFLEDGVDDLDVSDVQLLIDRMVLKAELDESELQRLADSVQTALFEGGGEMTILHESENGTQSRSFSNLFELDGLTFERPTVNFLSFNNPYGACKKCEGFGNVIGIDEDLVIPDKGLSLHEGCVAPWRGQSLSEWRVAFETVVKKIGFPIHRPFFQLSKAEKDLLWNGNSHIDGIGAFFQFLEKNSYKIQYRVMLSKYRGKTICPECSGTRLRKDASYVKLVPAKAPTIDGEKIEQIALQEVLLMNVADARSFFDQVEFSKNEEQIADRILKEIRSRLRFLTDVGLGYLGLNRLSNTLSGGESQRINLATSLGSSLVGSTYILDEPSIGLHSRDTERLISVLKGLRDSGNTVVVVEHDEDVMRSADHMVDVGPQAGRLGGEIVFTGDFTELNSANTLTSNYLTGEEQIEIPSRRRSWNNHLLLKGVRYHNLKGIDVRVPLNCITAITGVSGSGKTSLVKGVLFPALQRHLEQFTGNKVGDFDGMEGDVRMVHAVEMVDQNPIGKSSRSNPVTYVKAYDAIRDLMASMPLAVQRGYKSGMFSFNIEGGRCDNCKGEGEEVIEMQFMADLHLTCEVCKGKRFKNDILEVSYKQKNIHDILNMTVDEAMDFFEEKTSIQDKLRPLQDVGLGYVSLGQSSNTLSGGEAQRIKLASFLSKSVSGQHTVFIFDEPTTGLHFHDIRKLMKSFNALVESGSTVITIEHNLDVIKCADWVIDLGPEGGEEGGHLVYEGTPEGMVENGEGYTYEYLSEKL